MMVRPLTDGDRSWSEESLRRAWGSTSVARQGVLVDAAGLPGFVAVAEGRPVGLLTYARHGDEVEVVTLHVEREGGGAGRALMDAIAAYGRASGARRIWLITTNDNIRAIRFYQQWGMDLCGYVGDAVTISRRVKPSIPTLGHHGIPVRHELEFALVLAASEP
jgi:ribosomal protein S18 acetylase RimI-like enzyme